MSSRVGALTKQKEANSLTTALSLSRYIVERLVEETKNEHVMARLKALEMLGRHRDIDIFNPDSKVNVTVNNNKSSVELESEIKEKLKLILSNE